MRSRWLLPLSLLALACGDGAPPLPPPVADGAPSGIAECDAFVKAACECADRLPAAKSACELAKKSSSGWSAAANVPAQKEAAASSCVKASKTLIGYQCANP